MPITGVHFSKHLEVWGEYDWSGYLAQPWGGTQPVTIMCTIAYVSGGGEAELGILHVYDLDDNGKFRIRPFGDATYGSHPQAIHVPKLFGIDVTCRVYDAIFKGYVTMFLWG